MAQGLALYGPIANDGLTAESFSVGKSFLLRNPDIYRNLGVLSISPSANVFRFLVFCGTLEAIISKTEMPGVYKPARRRILVLRD